MSFSGEVKNEIAGSLLNEIENRNLLLGYLYINGEFLEDKVVVILENLAVARKILKTLKYSYKLDVEMTVRTQKKFKLKRIFIFEIADKNRYLEKELANIDLNDRESISSFVKGVFLAAGSINNPRKTGYHLEIYLSDGVKSEFLLNVLRGLHYNFKSLKRDKGYMLYLKTSEEISDFLKLLGAVNSLFYYEDIRIYRDHKNMVNRLNNCEQANLEKSLKTSDKQLEVITYLRDHDYFPLLDDKTRQVAEYRLKYPEVSFQNLADIMTGETSKKVTKSFVNHHFRKINEVYQRIIEIDESK